MLKGFSGRVCAVLAISCGAHAASDLRFDFDGDGKDDILWRNQSLGRMPYAP